MDNNVKFDNTYANLPENFYTLLNPTPVKEPKLIKFNTELAEHLGIKFDNLEFENIEKIFSGNQVLKGAQPLAMAYAGHQFGQWVPQLGDGRAILLGELIDVDGLRKDIQLKGSGKTPFSRMGDGRAWIGPVIREYLVSEAMYNLGIPSSRALSVVLTGENIIREQEFPGAVLTRVANSHVRVGTFQYFAARQDFKSLKVLTDYVINRHYPSCLSLKNKYEEFLKIIVDKQAYLVAKWMSVGFIHGVMNTDNTSIYGETIDYGPCAFMDNFSFSQVFSSIDHMGRYSYKNQPEIMKWNLSCLASCLLPLISENEKKSINIAQNVIDIFDEIYEGYWLNNFRAKLGLRKKFKEDKNLIYDLLNIMEKNDLDFTNTFKTLDNIKEKDVLYEWKKGWLDRLDKEKTVNKKRVNPIYIPRNHIIEEIINEALNNNYSQFHLFNKILSQPYNFNTDYKKYEKTPKTHQMVLQTFCGT